MSIFKVSKKAEDDLFNIGEYTKGEWGIEQRNKYFDDIERRFYQLADNPDYPSSKNLNAIKKAASVCLLMSILSFTVNLTMV